MLIVDKNCSQGAEVIGLSYNTVNGIERDWLDCFFCWQEHYFSVSYLYINTRTNWQYSIPLYNGHNLHGDPDLYYNHLDISLNTKALEMKIFLATHFYLFIIYTVCFLTHYWKMETFRSHMFLGWLQTEWRKSRENMIERVILHNFKYSPKHAI